MAKPGRDGAGIDRRTHQGGFRSGSVSGADWGQEAPDDRQQNRVSEEAVSQWGTASGCGQESGGVDAEALPVGSGFFPVIQRGIMELNVY
jgi:hypothetical protein